MSPYVHVLDVSQGGMGRVEVGLRRTGTFERLYAIKRLHPHLAQDPQFRHMFMDEAKLAGLVDHPNVVSVLDVSEDEQGPLLAMEYVEGLTLFELIGRTPHPLPMQVSLRLAAMVARGLHAAHELRDHAGQRLDLVHRDLSPQNVLVSWSGQAKVTDFGVAKALGNITRTATGTMKGKLGYASPEQLRYQPLDRRSDLFAFGVCLYELLTANRLYPSRGEWEGPRRILEEPAPDVGLERPDTPSSVVELCFRLLAKDAAKRPETAEEVARVLEAATRLLELEEGTLDTADWLEAEHGALRASCRIELEQAVQRAVDGVRSDRGQRTSLFAPRSRRWWRAALTATLVLAAATAGAVLTREALGGDEDAREIGAAQSSGPLSPTSSEPVASDPAATAVTPSEAAAREAGPEAARGPVAPEQDARRAAPRPSTEAARAPRGGAAQGQQPRAQRPRPAQRPAQPGTTASEPPTGTPSRGLGIVREY